jgi:hypothetical protein
MVSTLRKLLNFKSIYGLVLMVFMTVTAAAQTLTPVTTYNAKTDKILRPKPRAPSLGWAGTTVRDPHFNARILRVTGPNVFAGTNVQPGESFRTPSAGYDNPFNSNATYFFIMSEHRNLLFSFNEAAFTATCVRKANGDCVEIPSGSPVFSHNNPDILYATYTDVTTQHQWIMSYNIITGVKSLLFDVNSVIPITQTRMYATELRVSGDDNVFALAYGAEQNDFNWAVVYNKVTKVHHVIDTLNSTLDGKALPLTLHFGLHEVELSLDGNFVQLNCGAGYGNGSCGQWPVYNISAGTVYGQNHNIGHDVLGYGRRLNAAMLGNEAGPQVIERYLTQSSINNPWEIAPVIPNYGDYFYEDSHLSWANVRRSILPPVLMSYDYDNLNAPYTPTLSTYVYDGEIIAMETDGLAKKTWRFGHSFSDPNLPTTGSTFWSTSRGNVTPDGKFYMFTSNWEGNLGVDASGALRQDVFIIDLMSAY